MIRGLITDQMGDLRAVPNTALAIWRTPTEEPSPTVFEASFGSIAPVRRGVTCRMCLATGTLFWRQFRRWCLGVWDIVLQALADSGGDADTLQMIDSTTVRAHRCAAGERGGLRIPRSGARGAASPPRSISAATLMASLSARC